MEATIHAVVQRNRSSNSGVYGGSKREGQYKVMKYLVTIYSLHPVCRRQRYRGLDLFDGS